MAGKYGIAVIVQVTDILFDLGLIAKDVIVDRRPLKALGPAEDLFGLSKAGVNFQELGLEIKDLDGDDLAKYTAHVQDRLPELDIPAIELKISQVVAMLSDVEGFVQQALGIFAKLKTLIGF